MFHNPFAKHPISRELIPEAQHWFERNGEMICAAHYKTSVLWFKTLIEALAGEMASELHFDEVAIETTSQLSSTKGFPAKSRVPAARQ